jgi:hypothetical protein
LKLMGLMTIGAPDREVQPGEINPDFQVQYKNSSLRSKLTNAVFI